MVDKLTLPAKENAVQLKINDIIDNTTLESLKNVTITSPSAGQNLTYDATNQVWKNTSTTATVAWGGITGTLGDQSDLQNALNGKADDTDFVGADGTSAGSAGLVPAPAATDNTKFLKGDGTWGIVDALPSQSGQSGKYLTTNGTVASWGTITIPTKISDLTDDTATYPIDKADTLTGLTASITELNYTDGVTSAIQTQLDNKLATKPDGTNNLVDSNNKVNITYLPDVVLGQMLYAGTFVPSTAVATLSTNAKTILGTTSDTITLTNDTTAITGYKANEGNYYIASADGSFASISFLTGDWLLSTGSGWTKVSNTDAVTGVKGNAESTYRTGNVNITADNVLPIQTSNSGKFLTTNGSTASWATVDALPSQTSQSGKFLTTNGTTASWVNVPTEIPSQSGQSGKYLTTNGTSVSWGTISIPSKISDLTDDTATYPIDKADTLTNLTATVTELNVLDGITASTTELNYTDGVTSNIQTQLNNKLGKLQYEWNESISFGSTGVLCIGKFCCYDTNITIDIDATTSTTYHGTLVIATQNIGTSSGGSLTAKVYGDATNTITPNIHIYKHPTNDCLIEVYFSPQPWSKNLIHIRAIGLNKDHGTVSYSSVYSDICTNVSSVPEEATIVPTNALDTKQETSTAVTHTASTAVGSATQPTYVASDGTATACTYSLNKTVPSDAVFTDTKNTAGSTDTSSKIFLVGATSQAANPQTYSQDTAFVDTNGRLNSAAPAADANDTTVATTKWVADKGYTNTTVTFRVWS